MAEPIIIIKENPGKLRIEVRRDGLQLWGKTFDDVAFNMQSELEVDGSAKTRSKPKKVGDLAVVEIKIRSVAEADH